MQQLQSASGPRRPVTFVTSRRSMNPNDGCRRGMSSSDTMPEPMSSSMTNAARPRGSIGCSRRNRRLISHQRVCRPATSPKPSIGSNFLQNRQCVVRRLIQRPNRPEAGTRVRQPRRRPHRNVARNGPKSALNQGSFVHVAVDVGQRLPSKIQLLVRCLARLVAVPLGQKRAPFAVHRRAHQDSLAQP